MEARRSTWSQELEDPPKQSCAVQALVASSSLMNFLSLGSNVLGPLFFNLWKDPTTLRALRPMQLGGRHAAKLPRRVQKNKIRFLTALQALLSQDQIICTSNQSAKTI